MVKIKKCNPMFSESDKFFKGLVAILKGMSINTGIFFAIRSVPTQFFVVLQMRQWNFGGLNKINCVTRKTSTFL